MLLSVLLDGDIPIVRILRTGGDIDLEMIITDDSLSPVVTNGPTDLELRLQINHAVFSGSDFRKLPTLLSWKTWSMGQSPSGSISAMCCGTAQTPQWPKG